MVPILLVARTSSTRLPGKVLARLHGKTILEHLVDRLRLARKADVVVLCTTTLASDDPLEAVAPALGIGCYRGEPDDVPARLLGAALQLGAEFFVATEGDEVFTDADYVDQVIECYEKTGADYIKISGLPIGSWVSGVKVSALEQVCRIKPEGASDSWGQYLVETGDFRAVTVAASPPLPSFDPELRMTLDYPEDLEFVKAVFDRLYAPEQVFGLKDVVELLHRNPELIAINKHLNTEYRERCKTQHEAQFRRK